MKIDLYIAKAGFASRRKAKDLIDEKRVTVNGKTATFSSKFKEGDEVAIDGVPLIAEPFKPVYIMYHKPKGVVCTTEKIAGNIIDAVKHPKKVFPVGRLDKESEGLILLTNRGEIIDKIANASNFHEKEYIVTVNLPVRNQFLKEIAEGIPLNGEITRPCTITMVPGTKRIFRIVLTQGMNRQIRRMCNAYDYQVLKLQRVRVMHLELGTLKPGEWRDLTDAERTKLLEDIAVGETS